MMLSFLSFLKMFSLKINLIPDLTSAFPPQWLRLLVHVHCHTELELWLNSNFCTGIVFIWALWGWKGVSAHFVGVKNEAFHAHFPQVTLWLWGGAETPNPNPGLPSNALFSASIHTVIHPTSCLSVCSICSVNTQNPAPPHSGTTWPKPSLSLLTLLP